jgi:hypothetical protein
MSFVNSEPELLSSAAGNLAGIGESMASGTAAAEGPTTGVVAPASDLVSALTAQMFAAHGQLYQAMCQQAAVVHHQIATTLGTNASAYTAAEAANIASAV